MVKNLLLSFTVALIVLTSPALAQSADLSVIKTGPDEVAAGSDVTYHIMVRNGGPDSASDVTLTDPIPAGMTFVSANQLNGPTFACSSDTSAVTCTIAAMNAGEEANFEFVFNIPNDTPPGTSFTNMATATTSSLDENPENDSGVAGTSTPSQPLADMFVMKDGPSDAGPNTDVVYTLAFGNVGAADATNVTVTDMMPDAMTFVSLDHQSGPTLSCTTPAIGAPGTITCTAQTYPAGETSVYTLTGHLDDAEAGTEYTNQLTVSSDNDPNSENDNAQTTLITSAVDVFVVKNGPGTAMAGGTIDYTITVTNAGLDVAAPVLLHDELPANTTLVSFTRTSGQPATCDANDCEIPQLLAGQSTEFALTLLVGNTASITNTATVTSGQFDTDDTNNTSSTTATVTPVADLGVTKEAPATVVASTNATFTITLTNNGPSDAANVSLVDTIPADTTYVSLMQTSGPTFTCDTAVTCTRATFATGETAVFELTVNVSPDASGTLSNTATVTTTTEDTNDANDDDTTSTTITPAPADLVVTKTASTTSSTPNMAASYTIVVRNDGPGAATNVVVTDALPPGVALTSATPTQGTCSGTTTVTCTVGTLADDASATITLDVTLPPDVGDVTNTATATANEDDPNDANNSDSATIAVTPTPADLVVTKTASTTSSGPNSSASYTIVVTNNGPGEATDVVVTDELPPGVTLISATTTQGICSGTTTVTCSIGTLADAASATITLDVILPQNGGEITNTATATANEPDPNDTNSSGSATITVASAAAIPTVSPFGLALLALALAFIALRR